MENTMTLQNPASGNAPGLPNSPRTKGVLSAVVWNELHDFLTLALDALGDGPEDFDMSFLINAYMHQRLAMGITHGKMESLGRSEPRKLDRLAGCHRPRGGEQ
jgi:hypothetical protein